MPGPSGLPAGVGFANITRSQVLSQDTRALSVYGGDVLALDRWTFDFGLRVDSQRVRNRPSRAPDSAPPNVSGLVDGGLAMSPGEIPIHATWMYSVAALYELPWQMSVSGAIYGRQGYPTAEFITVNRPDGLGQTLVLRDRDLNASRFPDVHLLDLRVQKKLSVGRVQATLDLDLFNVLNNASTLRQIGEATATTFRTPLEIVAPRLVRLGLAAAVLDLPCSHDARSLASR